MKKSLITKYRGFTLIELLVVITIIGILATIVVVNLNSARGRGQDTAIKEQMAQLRAAGALYYDTQYGYTTGASTAASAPCITVSGSTASPNSAFPAGSFFQDTDFVRSAYGVYKNASVIPTCYIGGNTNKAQSWAMTSKMKLPNVAGELWCVDSIGNSVEIPSTALTADANGDYKCQ